MFHPPASVWLCRCTAVLTLALCAIGVTGVPAGAASSIAGVVPNAASSQRAATVPAMQVTCLDLETGRKAVIDDSAEPYFERLTAYEMSAFTGAPIIGGTRAEQVAECKRRFQQGVEAFTADEEAAIRRCVGEIRPLLAKDYPRFAAVPWSFLKLNDKIEGGIPHTRGPHIVLPAQLAADLSQAKTDLQDQKTRRLLRSYGSLFIHEQTHVIQRAHPELFVPLYTKVWKFQHVAALPPGDWLAARQLLNPDGTDLRWVYPIDENGQTRWVFPTAAFVTLDDPPVFSRRTMHQLAVGVEQTPAGWIVKTAPDGKPIYRVLSDVEGYVKNFTPSHNLYHPNEISADLFTALVRLEETNAAALNAKDTPLARFRTWARQTFGK